jgi:ubiquinone/menaquinone biosynthesis C-methylase UbiE
MSQPPDSFNPRRFRSTVPFYQRYRLGYPDSLIERTISLVGLKPGDAVMDLGCGPGLLAVPFARAGMSVVAVDPEPDMIAAAQETARNAGVSLDVRRGSSYDLPVEAGPFRLVTMGRSFHWMDRQATLKALATIVTADGAIALFDDDHPNTAENIWRRKLRDIGIQYGRNESPHLVAAHREDFRTHHSLLLESAFSRLQGLSEFVVREISADEIVGLAFSLSTSSRERLGGRAQAFEADLRAALAELSPRGRFTEIAEMGALVARRPGP